MTLSHVRFSAVPFCLAVCALLAPGCGHAAGQFTTVYSFAGQADGATPSSSVTVDLAGTIYGGAAQGGSECTYAGVYYFLGCGTIYKIDASGKQTTLFSFTGADGVNPSTKLTLIGDALYGGTQSGGKYGYGVLFGVHTDGTGFKILHNFDGKDGDYPIGPLIPVGNGAGFYGIAYKGGPGFNARGHAHDGELFELMRDGRLVVLHAFNGRDGAEPDTLLKDQNGTLFGAAYAGGTGCDLPNGCGTVYSYVPSTGQFTTLYQFTNKKDSLAPYLGSLDAAGNLYGATGANELGVIFELMRNADGYTYTMLHQLTTEEGGIVASGPTLLPNGSLVGATEGAGAFGGVLYLLDPVVKPSFRAFYTFPVDGPIDYGSVAGAQPIVGPRGVLYGTTSFGGPACLTLQSDRFPLGCGSVYSFVRVFSSKK